MIGHRPGYRVQPVPDPDRVHYPRPGCLLWLNYEWVTVLSILWFKMERDLELVQSGEVDRNIWDMTQAKFLRDNPIQP